MTELKKNHNESKATKPVIKGGRTASGTPVRKFHLSYCVPLCLVFIALFAFPARAAQELTGPGDVRVIVQDELGNAITGATVDLRLTGGDGILDNGFDILYTKTDGVDDDDSMGADGDVEFNSSGTGFSGNTQNGDPLRVTVTKTGYIEWEQQFAWDDSAVNAAFSGNQFTVKIIVEDELGNALTGASYDIQTGTVTGTDGGAGDGDMTGDGMIYIAQDPAALGAGPHAIKTTKTGYLDYVDNSSIINNSAQTVITTSIQYPFVIVAEDELFNTLDFDTAVNTYGMTATVTGLTVVDQKYAPYSTYDGAIYLAATGGPAAVRLGLSGYIETQSTLSTYDYLSSGSQILINFSDNNDGPALQYQIRVEGSSISLLDETGQALSLQGPGADPNEAITVCNDAACSAADTTYPIPMQGTATGTPYWDGSHMAYFVLPQSTGTKYIKLRKTGYIDTVEQGGITVNSTYGSSQASPDFSDGGAAEQMPFSVKIGNVETEAGSVHTQSAGDSVTFWADSGCSATELTSTHVGDSTVSGSQWYIAADQTASYYIKYDSSIYIAKCNAVNFNPSFTTQTTVDFLQSAGEGLLYPIKVIVHDELGNAIDVSDVAGGASFDNDEIVYDVSSPIFDADSGSNVLYFEGSGVYPLDDGGTNALNTDQGFLQIDTTTDTALSSVNTGTDAAGQTVITLSGTTPCAGGSVAAGASVTCRGLYYSVKVIVNNELGGPVTNLDPGDILLAASPAELVDSNTLYYRKPRPLGAENNNLASAANSPDGYLNIDTTVDTDLTGGVGVDPGTTIQTVITLSGGDANACSGSGAPLTGSVTCSGLDLNVKLEGSITQLEDEIGNALDITGAAGEQLKLYTAGACATETSYIFSPVYDGASDAWYAAVPFGSNYRAQFTYPGYVTTCDSSDITPVDTASTPSSPSFDDAGGDGLQYNIIIQDAAVRDALGNNVLLDDDFGEDAAIYTDAGCTTEATYNYNGISASNDAAYSGGNYYIPAATGTPLYGYVVDSAYLPGCLSSSITPDGTYQVSLDFTAGDALQFPLEFHVYSELGAPIDLESLVTAAAPGPYTVDLSVTSATFSSSNSGEFGGADNNIIYVALNSNDRIAGGVEGFIDPDESADTMLSSINPGATSPTIIKFQGGQGTNCTGGMVAAGSTITSCSGLDYNVKVSEGGVTEEFEGPVDLNGTGAESLEFWTGAPQALCVSETSGSLLPTATGPIFFNDAYYSGIDEGIAARARLIVDGYVRQCDYENVTADGVTVKEPEFNAMGFDALQYALRIASFQDELGQEIGYVNGDPMDGGDVIDGIEEIRLWTDSACTVPATIINSFFGFDQGWFIAAEGGSSYYISIEMPGYVNVCSGTSGGAQPLVDLTDTYTTSGAQETHVFNAAGLGALAYNVRLDDADIQDIAGNSYTIAGGAGEDFSLWTTSDCATTEATYIGTGAAAGQDAFRSVDKYYAAVATGTTYYAKFVPEDANNYLVERCNTVTIAPDGSSQVSPAFTAANSGNALRTPLVIELFDQLGNPLTNVADNDISSISGYFTQAGASGNTLYFYYNGAGNDQLTGSVNGFMDVQLSAVSGNSDIASQLIEPGTATSTSIIFTGTSPCATGANIPAGTQATCAGLFYNLKVAQGDVQDELGNNIDLDGSANEAVSLWDTADCSTTASVNVINSIGAINGYDTVTDAYYYAVDDNAGAGRAVYVKAGEDGYSSENSCSAAQTADRDTAVVNPTFLDGSGKELLYPVVVDVVQDELSYSLSVDNASTENASVYSDASCTTPVSVVDNTYASGATDAYWIAIDAGSYYMKFEEPGYVPGCKSFTVPADRAQQNVRFLVSGGDGLQYGVKLDSAAVLDETGATVTVDNNNLGGVDEDFALYTDSSCTTEASYYTNGSGAMDAIFGGSTWYAAVPSGSYYAKYTEPGLIPRCNSVALNYDGSGQAMAVFNTTGVNDLQYPVRIAVYDELGNAIDMSGGVHSIVVANTVLAGYVDDANDNTLLYKQTAAGTGGAVSGGVPGWLDINSGFDTQLADVSFGATSPTTISLDGSFIPCNSGSTVAAGATVSCSGLDYNVRLSASNVQNELGTSAGIDFTSESPGQEAHVYGNSSCTIAEDHVGTVIVPNAPFYGFDATTEKYYWPIQEDMTFYVKLVESGFIANCDADAVNVSSSGPILQTPSFDDAGDRLVFAMRLDNTNVEDELGNALNTMFDGDETLEIYTDAGCSTTATSAGKQFEKILSNEYYIALATGTYYIKYAEPGYVAECQSSANTVIANLDDVSTPQKAPSLDNTDMKALQYNIKIDSVNDEVGGAVTIDGAGAEDVAIYTDSGCTVEADYLPEASGQTNDALYSGNAWYIAAASTGTFYVKFTEPGYLPRCHPASVSPSGTLHHIVNFTAASGTAALQYPLRVLVYDELGNAIDIDTLGADTLAHSASAGSATAGNVKYFAATAVGALSGGAPGWLDINGSLDTQLGIVNPGTATPTAVILSGSTACNSGGSVAAESIVTCKGLYYNTKIEPGIITTEAGVPDYITIDGNETFSFHDSSANCVANAGVISPIAGGALNGYDPSTFSYYYALPESTAVYTRVSEPGFIDTCDDSGFTITPGPSSAATPAITHSVDGSSTTGMAYPLVVRGAESERHQAFSIDENTAYARTESVSVFTDSSCSTSDPGATAYYDSNRWFVYATNTVYLMFEEPGYVQKCAEVSVTPNTSAQQSLCFTDGAGNEPGTCGGTTKLGNLLYSLKVIVATETGQDLYSNAGAALTIADMDTLTYAGNGSTADNGGDTAYWAVIGSNASLAIDESGYVGFQNSSTGMADLTTGYQAQTVIAMGSSLTESDCTAASYDGSGPAGLYLECAGMQYGLKVTINDMFESDPAIYDLEFASLATKTFCGNTPTFEATDTANVAYWAGDGTSCQLSIGQTGYVNTDATHADLGAGGSAGIALTQAAQTELTFGDYSTTAADGDIAAGAAYNLKGLEAAFRISLYDEYGSAINDTGSDVQVTHSAGHVAGGGADAWLNKDQNTGNVIHLAPAAAGTLTIQYRRGYADIVTSATRSSDVHSVAPSANGVQPISFTGDPAAGATDCTGGLTPFATATCAGMRYNTIVFVDDPSGAVDIDAQGTSNFTVYNDNGSGQPGTQLTYGAQVLNFKEVTAPENDYATLGSMNGVYKMAIDNTQSTGDFYLVVKDVDADADINIDFSDAATATIDVDAIAANNGLLCADRGTTDALSDLYDIPGCDNTGIRLYARLDNITVASEAGVGAKGTAEAGDGSNSTVYETVTVTYYDDDGDTLGSGITDPGDVDTDLEALIDVVLTGGDSGTQKAIVWSDCAETYQYNTTTPITLNTIGGGDDFAQFTCKPDAANGGVVTFRVADTIPTAGSDITVSIYKSDGSFSNDYGRAMPFHQVDVEITPGAISHFDVTCGGLSQQMGVPFTSGCTVTAKDGLNNTIVSYATPVDIILEGAFAATGSLNIAQLGSGDFTNGIADLNTAGGSGLTYTGLANTSGTLRFQDSTDGTASGTVNVNMIPGVHAGYEVDCSAAAATNNTAVASSCTLRAIDSASNTVLFFSTSTITTELSSGLAHTITGGDAGGGTSITDDNFTNGVADLAALGITFTGTAGATWLRAYDSANPAHDGYDESFTVRPGVLDDYALDCNANPHYNDRIVVAPCTVTARDVSDNIITDFDSYDALYAGITTTLTLDGDLASVDVSGGSGPGGDQIDRSAFTSGVADLNALGITLAGSFSGSSPYTGNLAVTSSTGKVGSQAIQVNWGFLDHFAVSCTDPAYRNHEILACTVTALDVSGNELEDFASGTLCIDVLAEGTLTGNVTGGGNGGCAHSQLSSSDFTSGVADLNATGMYYSGAIGSAGALTARLGAVSGSDTIDILPGLLAGFQVNCPTEQVVNQQFSGTCDITALDGSGNAVTDFASHVDHATATPIVLSTGGDLAAVTLDSSISRTDFSASGTLDVTGYVLSTPYTGPVSVTPGLLQIDSGSGVVTGSGSLSVRPGQLDSYVVDCDSNPHVNGQVVTSPCTVTAQDISGNIITDFDTYSLYSGITTTVTLDGELAGLDISGGSGAGGDQLDRTSFPSGIADLNALGITLAGTLSGTSPYTGNLTATSSTAKTGSNTITVQPGGLDSFSVSCGTTDQRNREYFTADCTVTALDSGANVITSFNTDYPTHCISISVTGTGASTIAVGNSSTADCASGEIDAEDFTNGVANLNSLQVQHQGATGSGATLVADYNGGAVTGSTTINMLAGQLDDFGIDCGAATQTVKTALAGTCTATAHDADDNIITDFNSSALYSSIDAADIMIGITGDGALDAQVLSSTPVQRTEFASGILDLTATTLDVYDGPSDTTGAGRIQLMTVSPAVTSTGAIKYRPGQHGGYQWACGNQVNDTIFSSCTLTVIDDSSAGNVITDFDTYYLYSGITTTITADTELSSGTITSTAGGSTISETEFTSGVADLGALGFRISGTYTDNNPADGQFGGNLVATSSADPADLASTMIVVDTGALDDFAIICGAQQNDVPFAGSCTVTAYDSTDNVITTFSSAATLGVSGALSGGTLSDTDLTGYFINGVADVVALGVTYSGPAGAGTLEVTSGAVTATAAITISPGFLDSYNVDCSTDQMNNVAFTGTCTVTALDVSANVITDFASGTTSITTFVSTGGGLAAGDISGAGGAQGDELAAADFTSGVADLAAIGIMYTGPAGTGSLLATSDPASGGKTGSDSLTMLPGPLTYYIIDVQGPASATVDVQKDVTITAMDVSGNVVTDYAGAVTITADGGTGAGIAFAADVSAAGTFIDNGDGTASYQFDTADSGVMTFSISDSTPEVIDIDVTDGAVAENESDPANDDIIEFIVGSLSYYTISHDGEGIVGATETVTVSAYDSQGNLKTDYKGTVTLSMDGTASGITWSNISGGGTFADATPAQGQAQYTFVEGDAGTASFSIMDDNAESLNITVTDGLTYDDDTEGLLVFGFETDVTPPADIAYVNDGTGADAAYSTTQGELSANWAASSDAESGIARYWYSAGISAGASDTVAWTDNSTDTAVTISGLSLSDGATYYFNVKAENGDGLMSGVTSSNGQTYDSSAPSAATVIDGDGASDIDYTDSATSLSASWSGASDPDTGIDGYYYSIGTSAGATDTLGWTGAGTATAVTVSSLTLAENTTYYFNVKAANPAGLYSTVASSDGATVDLSAPVISIASPAESAVVSGFVTVTGTVSDIGLASWSLYYGPGAAPSSWKTIATGTAGVATATIAGWNTSSLTGDYTLKLEAEDRLGNTSQTTTTVTVSGNEYTISGTVAAFHWTLLSVPAQPSPADPLTLFGATGQYKIYRWDPDAEDDEYLAKYVSPDTLGAGQGFWIQSYYNDLTYAYSAAVTDTSGEFTVPLGAGWNMIGPPFNRAYQWGQVEVRYGGTDYSLAEAAEMGLMSSLIDEYDTQSGSFVLRDATYMMSPQAGYFARAYADVELVFDPGAGLSGGLARIVRTPFDYKIELAAATGDCADAGNYLGAARTAADGYDTADAPEPPRSPHSDYVSLYFQRDDWQDFAGRYAADVRASDTGAGDTESWNFTVETNQAGETVTLSWNSAALPAHLYSFTLVNLDTGERIDMTAQDDCSYVAPGGGVSQARFRIEVVKLALEETTLSINLQPGWHLISIPLDPELTGALEQLGDDLPDLTFFQFFGSEYYSADSADIQAGLGYWIYVDSASEIDITGLPVPETQAVEIPLAAGWNLVGNPYAAPVTWGDNIRIESGDSVYSLSEAVSAGLIADGVFTYSDGAYSRLEPGADLLPWKGCFLKVAENGVLVISK